MQIDIDDGDTAGVFEKMLGGNTGIVEEAETTGNVPEGVVSGWAAERVRPLVARHDRFTGRNRTPCAPIGAFPGMFGDRARRIGNVIADLPDGRGRVSAGAGDRVNIGNDLGIGLIYALPALVDAFEEVEIFRRMDRGYRPETVVLRSGNFAACRTRAGKQALDPFWLLWIGLWRTARRGTVSDRGVSVRWRRRFSLVCLCVFGKGFESLAADRLDLLVAGMETPSRS